LIKDVTAVDVAIAPPFTSVAAAAEAATGSAIGVGAQNMHWERDGAFTGEISATMIRETGARYVIIGHSERRTLFGETNETVNKKTHAALTAALVPIVCIGETLDQRDRNETMAVLDRQIKESLDRVTGEQLSGMVLAYEPVWAIGTGRNATPAQAGEAHFHIRQRLKQWFGLDASERCRVLYGGSVKPDNIAKLIAEPDVDGALVGGASLDPKSFFAIIQGAAKP
jgi:triosephosphate isomerase